MAPVTAIRAVEAPAADSRARGRARFDHIHGSEVLAVALFVLLVACVLGASAGLLLGEPRLCRIAKPLQGALHALAAAGVLCILYGILIEPYRLSAREFIVKSPKLSGENLRIVHLSDLHVRRWGRIEERVLSEAARLKPDLILLTGDYSAFPGTRRDALRLLDALSSIASTYCVRGNSEFSRPLHGDSAGSVRWLLNDSQRINLRGNDLTVVGADPGQEGGLRTLALRADPASFVLALYHYPDLVPELAQLPVDLLLSGHSHGGQVRLPFVGALASASRAGVHYVQGLFLSKDKAAHVSAGVGCESYGLPCMRFLCPPEMTLIVLQPATR